MAPFFFSQRGALLTPTGRQKLETAVHDYYQGRNLRVNSQRIAEQAGLPLDLTIGILYGQSLTSKRTLKQFFQGFEVPLGRQDFQIVRPEREPHFAQSDATAPLTCVGREAQLEQMRQALQTDRWLVVLAGASGSGKTTLAQHLLEQAALRDEFPLTLTVDLSQLWAGFATLARQVLGEAIAHKTLAAEGMAAVVTAVIAKLQSQPIVLWLQNLTPELAQTEPFEQFWSGVLASETLRSRLLVTTTGVNLPPSDRIQTVQLPGLELDAIAQLYTAWGVTLDTTAQQTCLETIHQTYEGHPLALKLVAGEIRSFPYFGNLLAYWQDYGYECEITPTAESGEGLARPIQQPISPWLRTLGDRILQRLTVHAPLAADLLQLGATNAQPTPAYGWYFLMGEFSAPQQATTLKALQERLLVESLTTAQGVRYGVHPVLRCIIKTLHQRS